MPVARHDGPALDLVWLENELDRLARRHEKLLHDIDDVEADLADSRQMLRDLDQQLADADEVRLADRRAALRRVEDDLRLVQQREELLQTIAKLEQEVARLTWVRHGSDLLQEAEGLLRRMSAANLVGVQLDQRDTLQVVDEHGVRRGYDDLSEGQRCLVHLSLCLALVAQLGRRGLSCPLILSNIFTHVDSKIVPEAAELLRDFATAGRQILVLTRFDHVASVFRLLNVRVRHLDASLRHEARLAEIVRDAADDARVARDRVGEEDHHDHAFRLWDAEEFPGELADRVRRTASGASRTRDRIGDLRDEISLVRGRERNRGAASAAPLAESAAYALTEAHSLADAPSIDPVNVDRLRKIGILAHRRFAPRVGGGRGGGVAARGHHGRDDRELAGPGPFGLPDTASPALRRPNPRGLWHYLSGVAFPNVSARAARRGAPVRCQQRRASHSPLGNRIRTVAGHRLDQGRATSPRCERRT